MFHAGACSLELFFSTHRHAASTNPARLVSVPIRHPSDKSSAVTSFETDIYIYIANATRYQVHTRYTHSCGVCLFLEHGGGALGVFKSPVCTYDQAWTFSLSASRYFSFLSVAGGVCRPRSEAPCTYVKKNDIFCCACCAAVDQSKSEVATRT